MIGKSYCSTAGRFLPLFLMIGVSAFIFCMSACRDNGDQPGTIRTGPVRTEEPERAGFVDRQLCIDCHMEQYKEWIGSRHDLTMDVATDETVKGDFNNTTFINQGEQSTFYRIGGKYFVRSAGPDGGLQDKAIAYVIGVSPFQQYMVESPDGRIQLLETAWDNRPENRGGQRWTYLHPDEEVAATRNAVRTQRLLSWNSVCGECYTTNFRKNYDLNTDSFRTQWDMIDVGCQACHGPGSRHVEWARSTEGEESGSPAPDTMGLEVDLRAEDATIQVEACARCHSSRFLLRGEYEYGKPFMDFYVPQVLIDSLYYPDGQIQDEGHEYGSFLQSKKYQHGVRCTECHDPHTDRLRTYGNELCIQCHSSPPAPQFSFLKDKDYDSPLHHFHKENSPGAQCVECHMSGTAYMVVDSRRDHSFKIPRPDLSVKLGIPNACSKCHTGKSAQWAADKIKQVHASTRSGQEGEGRVAEIFNAGRAGAPGAEPGLIKIAGDRSEPSIVRATALNILSGYRSKNATGMTALSLLDDDPLVRYEAVKALSALIPETSGADDQRKKYSLLSPLLRDSIRAVRSETARAVAEVPSEFHTSADRDEFEKALEEYKEQQEVIAERPDAHLNLGILYEDLGQNEMAAASYKTAVRLAGDFYPARFKLADLYKRTGRSNEAEQQYREIIRLEPEQGEAYHLLGLLLSEGNRLDEAVSLLGTAVEFMPGEARVRYNYALTLRHLGRNDEALQEMIFAFEIDRRDPAIVQAIAIFYIQDKQWERALYFTELLVTLVPEAERPKHMLKQIHQVIQSGKENIE